MIKRKYQEHKETVHNFFWRALQVIGKDGIIFLIFLISARLLTPYEFGIYNYILAAVFFLIMFGDFGISTATSKYVAEYNVIDKRKLKLILFSSGLIIFGLTVLMIVLTVAFGKFFLADKYRYILYLLPLVFLAPMTSLYDGVYRGLKKFKRLALISIIVGVISLSFVYFLISHYGLIGALISQNLFYLILLISLAVGHKEFNFKLDRSVTKSLLQYSIIIGVINLSYFLYSRFDILILGKMGFIVEIGYYELVNKFLAFLMLPLLILSQINAPNIVSTYYKKKKSAVLAMLRKNIKYSLLFSIVISLVAFIVIPFVIEVILPSYYNQNLLTILYILLFVFVFQSVSSFIGNSFIVSTGHAKINMIILIIFGILNVVLDLIFIYYFGFIGVAYSKIVVGVTSNVILMIWYYLALKRE